MHGGGGIFKLREFECKTPVLTTVFVHLIDILVQKSSKETILNSDGKDWWYGRKASHRKI